MRLFYQTLISLTLLSIVLTNASTVANAQVTIETGISIGFNRHTFTVDGDNQILQPGIGLAATYGLPIIVTKNNWELHFGIFVNNLTQSYYFSTSIRSRFGQRGFSSGLSTYKIPIRIGRSIQWTDNVSLSPQIGFSWLTSQRTGITGTASGSRATTIGRIDYTTVYRVVNKNKFLAEMGLDINVDLFSNVNLAVGAMYTPGLQTIEVMDVSYQVNQGRTLRGTVNSKGAGWKFNIGIKFPIVTWN